MGFRTVFNGTIVGLQYVQTQAGEFYYAGSPAKGNLVASIAAAAGTDPYGNAYSAGIVSYDPLSFLRYVQLASGAVELGSIGDSPTLAATIATAFGAHTLGQLLLTCQTTAGAQTASVVDMRSGVTGSGVGSSNAPRVWLGTNDGAGNTAVQAWTAGPLVLTSPAGTPYAWATPSYSANWTGSGAGFPALQLRPGNDDNLQVVGSVTATAAFAAGTNTIGTITAGAPYIPKQSQSGICLHTNSGNTNIEACQFRVSNAGVLQIASGAVAAGDRFQINLEFPLGNIS